MDRTKNWKKEEQELEEEKTMMTMMMNMTMLWWKVHESSHFSSNRCWYIDDEKGQDQTAIFGNNIEGRTRFTWKDLFMYKNIPELTWNKYNILCCAFMFWMSLSVFTFAYYYHSKNNRIVGDGSRQKDTQTQIFTR